MPRSRWFHGLLLLVWIAVGAGLRLFNLTTKPLWTDEFATLVFSLGHSFHTVPLDQVISAATLLQPLVPDGQLQLGAVVTHLFSESTHPPLYFWLTHVWLHLFPSVNGLVSLWGARALSALFGVLAIPAIFGLVMVGLRSQPIAHLAAILMATSPLGIYLAQEARHYTLPTLWVIASLTCFVSAWQRYHRRQRLPLWLIGVWIGVNGLGMASHYFFSLALIAEGLVVAIWGITQWSTATQKQQEPPAQETEQPVISIGVTFWSRIGAVALGTLATMAVWWPLVQGIQDSEITQWIQRGGRVGVEWVEPVLQLLAGAITMLYLLPIPNTLSFIILVLLIFWTGHKLYQGLRWPRPPLIAGSIQILGGFVVAALVVFLAITYGLEKEVTSAPRYHFVFFPALLILVATALVTLWERGFPYRRAVVVVLCFSVLGALTVITDLGYQKVHRPDIVTAAIRETLPTPTLVAILHRTHGQTGRLMAIAWELQQRQEATPTNPLFLLAHQEQTTAPALQSLENALATLPRPLNLWLINFRGITEDSIQQVLQAQGCTVQPDPDKRVDGYRYRLHICESLPKS